jgi:hypothetical protein
MIPTLILIVLMVCGSTLAAAHNFVSIKTNFVAGAVLSENELQMVVDLARICGIEQVMEVRTARSLRGLTVSVKSLEKLEGRQALFETLLIHRDGWEFEKPSRNARSVGEFWVEAAARPMKQERTIIQVGKRSFRVGLLNGITPKGADLIVDAFVNRRLQYASDHARSSVSEIDFTHPSWLGVAGRECWITFASPLTQVRFQVKGKDVIILDVIQMFE